MTSPRSAFCICAQGPERRRPTVLYTRDGHILYERWAYTIRETRMHPDPVGSLTRREIEVLWLLDARLSIEEIAEVLHLSPEALQSYRSRLVRKLTLRLLPPCNPERSQERPDGHCL